MRAYIITMSDNDSSVSRAEVAAESVKEHCANIAVEFFEATQPKNIYNHTGEVFGKQVPWTWPSSPNQDGLDLTTGLYKKYYPAKAQDRVVACALSHYRLWKLCAEQEEPILVLEHDARFVREFSVEDLADKWGAVGLNDPRGNTRKGRLFHSLIEKYGEGIQRVPVIDEPTDPPLPMGIAGNSAYIIKPYFAKKLLEEVERVGMWPNDAIMCRQLFPTDLKVVYPYYTVVQSGVSTTTGI